MRTFIAIGSFVLGVVRRNVAVAITAVPPFRPDARPD
jgi:hypothetical protein